MSRVAVLGSNALATAVQFYAAALEEATQRADQNAVLLKQAVQNRVEEAPRGPSYEEWLATTKFADRVISIMSREDVEPVARCMLIWEAVDVLRDARRTAGTGARPNVVPADDPPRGGAVRDSVVPG